MTFGEELLDRCETEKDVLVDRIFSGDKVGVTITSRCLTLRL